MWHYHLILSRPSKKYPNQLHRTTKDQLRCKLNRLERIMKQQQVDVLWKLYHVPLFCIYDFAQKITIVSTKQNLMHSIQYESPQFSWTLPMILCKSNKKGGLEKGILTCIKNSKLDTYHLTFTLFHITQLATDF